MYIKSYHEKNEVKYTKTFKMNEAYLEFKKIELNLKNVYSLKDLIVIHV